DHYSQELWVLEGAVADPLASRFAADDDVGGVIEAIPGVVGGEQGELLSGKRNGGFLARQGQPARSDVKSLGVPVTGPGRVSRRIDRDGVEEDRTAHPGSEYLLQLDELCGFEWTRVPTVRVDEADDDLLVFDEIVVEADRPAILREEGNVRKVVHSPRGA